VEDKVHINAGVAGLVCALFLGQQQLCRTRLLASYPPREPVPMAMHGLGLASGLLALALQR